MPRKSSKTVRPEIPYYAKRLRDLREDRDINQQTVAELISVSQRTYSDYELGYVRVPVDSLLTLAKYYNVDMNYICGLTAKPVNFPDK